MKWEEVESKIMKSKFHQDYLYYKKQLPDPSSFCLEPSVGKPRGQIKNWRKTLPDGSCLHVLEFKNIYIVHRDRANPNDSIIKHIALDEPKLILLTFWIPMLELWRILFRCIYKKRQRNGENKCNY
ncbi:MAG: hypothetical protein F7B11_05230 [Caldisphaeraceae archaeon]|nr:hypothetical protein [Caldisphaeraceae archaeon]